ncbi:MAG: NAD synthetase [Elainella sp. C42_A2020_010]|nr:NAD synthetase [Elainella sp. C42_A2020_010]
MESTAWMDWLAGGLAAVILLGGLVMLFSGVSAMNQRK